MPTVDVRPVKARKHVHDCAEEATDDSYVVPESRDAMAGHAAANPLCLQTRSRSEDVSLVAHRELEFEFQRNQEKGK